MMAAIIQKENTQLVVNRESNHTRDICNEIQKTEKIQRGD